MIKDHRPYFLKAAYRRWEKFYVRRFLAPQLAELGAGFTFMKPWHVEIFGWPIKMGRCVNVIAAPDMKVRLSVWSDRAGEGRIIIGDYCLLCPGVRLGSAKEINIGHNSMLAHGVYITDSDWHDIYNRIAPCLNPAPVIVEENVWIGDSAIICKGVTIGRNSIVGAGAVVTDDIPPNSVAAGNPARVVRRLNPKTGFTTRAEWFQDFRKLDREINRLDRDLLQDNTLFGWLRHLFFPAQGD